VKGAEIIAWDVKADDTTRSMLPEMKTDISIRWPDRYLVIDTKFYKETMQTFHGKRTVHSDNLFQIFAYLQHIDSKGPEYQHCEGMLLYPTVSHELNLEYFDHGHWVMARTVDLSQPWRAIHERLLTIVKTLPETTASYS